MLPVLHLGPAAIQTSRLLLLAGIFAGLSLTERFSRRRGENADRLTNLFLLSAAVGLIVARLAYAAVHLTLFQKNPLALISLDPVLLDPLAGAAGTGIAALAYGQRKGLHFWASLNGLTPFMAVMAVFISLAHLASGQAFGTPTTLPWGIELWGGKRHPSQLYELIGAVAVLVVLWKQFRANPAENALFLKFSAFTAGLTVFLSAFRADSRLILGTFREEQILALIILAVALLLLEVRSIQTKGSEDA